MTLSEAVDMKKWEDAMRVIMEALAFLEKTKVKAERPIPVVKDRQGKLAQDYMLKEWFAKLDEELNELKNECLSVYTLEDKPGQARPPYVENKLLISGELCDLIKTGFSMVYQMDMNDDFMEAAMHNCNVKTRKRGCHE